MYDGARLLTLNEIKDLIEEQDGTVFLEDRDEDDTIEADASKARFEPYYAYGNGIIHWTDVDLETDTMNLGDTWRAWSERPTTRQRNDTRWE